MSPGALPCSAISKRLDRKTIMSMGDLNLGFYTSLLNTKIMSQHSRNLKMKNEID
jgi:hypothetical protein